MSKRRLETEHVLTSLEDLRRLGGETMVHWLNRSAELLTELFDEVTEIDDRLRLAEACGKLAERFCRFSGLDKPLLKNSGNVVVELVRRAEAVEATN